MSINYNIYLYRPYIIFWGPISDQIGQSTWAFAKKDSSGARYREIWVRVHERRDGGFDMKGQNKDSMDFLRIYIYIYLEPQ